MKNDLDREGKMELSKPQKLIYDMEKFSGGSISVICGSLLINGKREVSELKSAVRTILMINDALRIRISENGDKAEQSITEYQETEPEVMYFENRSGLDAFAENYAKMPLDLYGNLCEITVILLPEQYGLLVKLHHIIGDAWTLSLLGNQFSRIMNDETLEAYSYFDYIENEKKYTASRRYGKDREFFLEQFKNCDEMISISEKPGSSLVSERRTFVIPAAETEKITAFAASRDSSPFMLFMSALAIYISRTKMNAEKFFIGTDVLNRSDHKEKNTAGMFINTVPMLIQLDNQKSFAENLSGIENSACSVFRHQKYNCGDMLCDLRQISRFDGKLYDVVLNYQNAKIGGNVETAWYHCGMQNESLQIHIEDRDDDGIFRVHYDYQTDKFTAREIELLHDHLINLLFSAVSNENEKICDLDILTMEERQNLFVKFNSTAAKFRGSECIHSLFEARAAMIPEKTALIASDRVMTYTELNEQANRIAHGLLSRGIGSGDIAAVSLPRTADLIAALLGILKTGAAFLPIDPTLPKDRVDYMLADSGAKILITEKTIGGLISEDRSSDPGINVPLSDLCYCIYTSGSTGLPKGTLIAHSNIRNTILWRKGCYRWENKYIVSITNVTADTFIEDLFTALLSGNTFVFVEKYQDLNEIGAALSKYRHSAMMTTPTFFKTILNSLDGNLPEDVILVGEALEARFAQTICEKGIRLHNEYGPSETAVCAAYTEIDPSATADFSRITIGSPISNTRIYITDKFLSPVPVGTVGELCIAGDGVGMGYLNRPELTAEKFCEDPFEEGRLYRTGDLAYWREDGSIVFIGRTDFQVKIRGLRIEPGEIENAISAVDGITQSVVVVRKNNEGRQLICAFYTGEKTEAKTIRDQIRGRLPKYMIPHIFTHLESMPLTFNGKVNRKALPAVDLEHIAADTEYEAPATEQQKELCGLMEAVLNTSPIGIKDDFFDLGGDSLKAIEFASRAHCEGIYFNLQTLFDNPTVQALCEAIEQGDRSAVSFEDTDFSTDNSIISGNTPEASEEIPQETEPGNVLITGATGFLGIHILADFLDHDSGIAYCPVRGKDPEDSQKRMDSLLNFYFGDKYTNNSRIRVICSDMIRENFGMSDEEYQDLLDNVDTVINCAASVKHYGSYRYFYETNVVIINNLIRFCKAADAKLIHTSTLSVSGNSFTDNFSGTITGAEREFSEQSLYIGQPLDNVYARSKFEAEKAVLDAMADGLQANIMRMGNLTSRSADGVFQKNYESNAFLKRLRSVMDIGSVPDYLMDLNLEFTPIDEAAAAVMTIVRHFDVKKNVFHIRNPKHIFIAQFVDWCRELGYDLHCVKGDEFTAILRQTIRSSGMEYIYEALINDMDENDRLHYTSSIRIDSTFTEEYLKKLGFEWTSTGFTYIKNYLDYFRKIGYLK